MEILISEHEFKVPQGITILQMGVAYDDSIVLLTKPVIQDKKHIKPQQIIHMSSKGDILKNYNFKGEINRNFIMPNGEEVVFLLSCRDEILTINLRTNQHKKDKLKPKEACYFQRLYYFKETGIVALQENIKEIGNFARITYLKYPFIQKPILVYDFMLKWEKRKQDWQLLVAKGNNHSLFIIRQTQCIYSLKSQRPKKITLLDLVIDETTKQVASRERCIDEGDYKIISDDYYQMWEYENGKLMMFSEALDPQKVIKVIDFEQKLLSLIRFASFQQKISAQVKQKIQDSRSKLSQYYFASSQELKRILKQSQNCLISKYKVLFTKHFIKINIDFKSKDKNKGEFYLLINGLTPCRYKKEKKYFQWVNTCQDYEYSVLREGKYYKEGNMLVVVTSRPMEVKDAYMMFMLHLNQDFDDDLLLDALRKLVDDL